MRRNIYKVAYSKTTETRNNSCLYDVAAALEWVVLGGWWVVKFFGSNITANNCFKIGYVFFFIRQKSTVNELFKENSFVASRKLRTEICKIFVHTALSL